MSHPRRKGEKEDARSSIKNCSNRLLACRQNGDEDGHTSVGGISDDKMVDGKYGKINLSGICGEAGR